MNTSRCTDESYIQFLIASPGPVSGAEAARVQLDSPFAPAHDSFTRLLNRLEHDPETLPKFFAVVPTSAKRTRLDSVKLPPDQFGTVPESVSMVEWIVRVSDLGLMRTLIGPSDASSRCDDGASTNPQEPSSGPGRSTPLVAMMGSMLSRVRRDSHSSRAGRGRDRRGRELESPEGAGARPLIADLVERHVR